MKENFTPAELLVAVRATGAEPYIGADGIAKVRNKDRIPPELLEVAREHLPELLALLDAEVEAVRSALDAWIEPWERGCRWLAADPARTKSTTAYERMVYLAAGWGWWLHALETLAPADPALSAANERLDTVALETDNW
jgi:hypothetical protein